MLLVAGQRTLCHQRRVDDPRGNESCRFGVLSFARSAQEEPLLMAMFLTIKAGAVVTWTNTDDEPHIVWSGRGPTRSAVRTEESISFTFDEPGTYHCACSLHPRMIVTVVVE